MLRMSEIKKSARRQAGLPMNCGVPLKTSHRASSEQVALEISLAVVLRSVGTHIEHCVLEEPRGAWVKGRSMALRVECLHVLMLVLEPMWPS